LGLAGVNDALASGHDLVEGGDGVGQQRLVAQEGNVFNGVRNAVGCPVEGHGTDRGRGERGGLVAQLHGCNDAVLDELAYPVMRANNQVRALARGYLGNEIVADRGEVLDDELYFNASLRLELGGNVLQCGCALGINPHGDGAGPGGGEIRRLRRAGGRLVVGATGAKRNRGHCRESTHGKYAATDRRGTDVRQLHCVPFLGPAQPWRPIPGENFLWWSTSHEAVDTNIHESVS